MPVELVAVGHVLCETIVFADGQRKGPLLGSPAAYASAVSARLGVPTGIVTKVGPDAPPGLLAPLREAGVDFTGIDFASPLTTTNELVYADDGTKELKYLRQAGPITLEDIPADYRTASVFHVGPLDYEVPLETLSQIAQLGAIVSVDLGGYGGAHVRRDKNARQRPSTTKLRELVSLCTVVKASDEDARLIFSYESLTEQEVARRFTDWGAHLGIVTMGSKGSLVASAKRQHHIPAFGGDIVDVTGGGDSFIAAFLVDYFQTGNPWQSALFAAAVARFVIGRTGGVLAERMPTMETARNLLDRLTAGTGIGST